MNTINLRRIKMFTLINKSNNRKDIFQTLMIAAMITLSPLVLEVLKTDLSAGGAARMYFNEIIILMLGVYIIFYKLLIKKKWNLINKNTAILLLVGVIFGVYYVLSLLYRIKFAEVTFGSFFLARIVIEATIIIVAVDYFKIKISVLLKALLIAYIVAIGTQYVNLMRGIQLRGSNETLTISYIYTIFLNMCHGLLAFLWVKTKSQKERVLATFLYLISLPTIFLTGSRVGFVLSLFIVFMVVILLSPKDYIKTNLLKYVLLVIISLSLFAGTIAAVSNANKVVAVRSVSIPINLIKKVTPSSVDTWIDSLLLFDVDNDDIGDITSENDISDTEDYLNETSEVSSAHRKEANAKAYQIIFDNPINFAIGTGASIIHRYDDVYQKPHNYFAQYALAFGVLGFIATSVLYFSGVIITLRQKNFNKSILLISLIFSMIVNSFLQPSFGNILGLFSFILVVYVFANGEDDMDWE